MQSICNALSNEREKSVYTEGEKELSKMHGMKLHSAETGSKCPYLTIWSQMKGVIKGKWQQQKEKKFPELGKTFSHGLNVAVYLFI